MRRLLAIVTAASSNVCLVLILSGCGSSSPTGAPEPSPPGPTPTPTPTVSSPYAGSWRFTIWLTAVGNPCGHTQSDIDVRVGPIPVTVTTNGSFSVPSPVDASGTIDSSGSVRLSLAARTGTCTAGEGAGGCVNVNHCDGTSVQVGDVSKWTLVRP